MAESLLQRLVESVTQMPGKLEPVATNDPLAAVMLGVGGLLFVLTFGYVTLLVLGALAELVSPSGGGRQHPRGR